MTCDACDLWFTTMTMDLERRRSRALLDPKKKKILLTCISQLLSNTCQSPILPTLIAPTLTRPPLSFTNLMDPTLLLFTFPAAVLNLPPPTSPHPEQGGQRITHFYLETLTRAECKWAFR